MIIRHEFPPNFGAILKVFPKAKGKAVIFTYGDTLYVPYPIPLSQAILAHEQVHALQQEHVRPSIWWEYYLKNPRFRLQEELAAHRAEYLAYALFNRKIRQAQLNIIAAKLASPLYNSMITKNEAKRLLRICPKEKEYYEIS